MGTFTSIFSRTPKHRHLTQALVSPDQPYRKVARELPDSVADKYGVVPEFWKNQDNLIRPRAIPAGSGMGYTSSPYINEYNKTWGVNPTEDMDYYREIYDNEPFAQAAVRVLRDLTLRKGYDWVTHPDAKDKDKILKDVEWIFHLVKSDFDETILPMMLTDMLVYGGAYVEPVLSGKERQKPVTQRHKIKKYTRASKEYKSGAITELIEDTKAGFVDAKWSLRSLETGNYIAKDKVTKKPKGEVRAHLHNIKCLDPLTMKVLMDAFGNVFGYVQYASTPLVAFDPSKIMHPINAPRSTINWTVYGTSLFKSMIRLVQLKRALENNYYIVGHSVVKPALIYSASTEGMPLGAEIVTQLRSDEEDRVAGDSVILQGPVTAKPLSDKSVSPLKALNEHYNRIINEFIVGLGLPKSMLGLTEGTKGNVKENFETTLVRIHGLQSLIAMYVKNEITLPIMEMLGWTRERLKEAGLEMKFKDIAIADEDLRAKMALQLFKGGIMTRNEARRYVKLPDEKGETADYYFDDVEIRKALEITYPDAELIENSMAPIPIESPLSPDAPPGDKKNAPTPNPRKPGRPPGQTDQTPRQEKSFDPNKASATGLSSTNVVLFPGMGGEEDTKYCPECKHTLLPWQIKDGKCVNCGTKIVDTPIP